MPFFTPRGLKIGFDLPYAFGLMGRLYPRRSAFQILKTVEGLDDLPSLAAFLAAVLVLAISPSLLGLTLGIVAGRLVGVVMIEQSLLPTGLPQIVTVVSWITGYGLFWVVLILLSFSTLGWFGLLAVVVVWLISIITDWAIEIWMTALRSKMAKMTFTRAELEFYLAYRLHAERVGVAADFDLSDDELDSGKWVECLRDYAKNYPEAVSRFSDSYEAVIRDISGATEWQKLTLKRQKSATT